MSYKLRRLPGSPDGVFRQPLAPDAPLAPTSADFTNRLLHQTRYFNGNTPISGPWGEDFVVITEWTQYTIPLYMMPSDHPTSRVYHRQGGGVQNDLLGQAWMNVPVPDLSLCKPGINPNGSVHQIESNGSDASVAFIRDNELWEFWHWAKDDTSPSGFSAEWGGYHPNFYTARGMYRDNFWGIVASGIVAPSGLITWRDAELGEINHALSITIPNSGGAPNYVSPCTRGDAAAYLLSGATETINNDKLQHGVRFRIPADFDVEGWASDMVALHSTINYDLHLAVLKAVRDYGIYVMDTSGGVIAFRWEDSRTIGTPYSPYATMPGTWTNGTPRHAFKYLPWAYMQQVAVPPLPFSPRALCRVGGAVKKIRYY